MSLVPLLHTFHLPGYAGAVNNIGAGRGGWGRRGAELSRTSVRHRLSDIPQPTAVEGKPSESSLLSLTPSFTTHVKL